MARIYAMCFVYMCIGWYFIHQSQRHYMVFVVWVSLQRCPKGKECLQHKEYGYMIPSYVSLLKVFCRISSMHVVKQ